MTGHNLSEIMTRRMALVAQLSAFNAKHLRSIQARSGIEVELLACIESIERDGEAEDTLAHRAELENRFAAAAAACADCDRELELLNHQLNELDRELSGS